MGREEFDEEKEPDRTVLSGWTGALAVEKNNDIPTDNGAGSSSVSQTVSLDTQDLDEIEIISAGTPNGKKRKASDISIADETCISRKPEAVHNDDVIRILDESDHKKKKVQ